MRHVIGWRRDSIEISPETSMQHSPLLTTERHGRGLCYCSSRSMDYKCKESLILPLGGNFLWLGYIDIIMIKLYGVSL